MRKKLRQLRIQQDLTQASLAEMVGIKRSSYSNIEAGHKNPSFIIAVKIKEALHYESDDIFELEGGVKQ